MAKLSFKQQLEGFPKWQILVFCLARLSEPIAFTSLFPYMYFMIRDFGVAKDKADIATYSGYLAASFAFFQFMFLIKWGQLSDVIGRKNTLMWGFLGSGISLMMFAFARSYWFALFARCVMGFFNGTIPVVRTVLAELAPETRHHAMAFTCLPLMWNIGAVLGPMIGGSKWLTRPKEDAFLEEFNLDTTYNKFMEAFPYAMSNLVVAAIMVVSFLVTFLFLDETQPESKHKRDRGIDIGDYIRRFFGFETPVRPWHNQVTGESLRLLEVTDDAKTRREATYSEIFPRLVIQTISANFLLASHSVIYSEFLPVLLAGDLHNDQLHFPKSIVGGFGFKTTDIGNLLSITGLVGGLSVIVIFPLADYHYSTLNIYRFSTLVFPLAYAVLPYLVFTLPSYNPALPTYTTRICLYFVCGIVSLGVAVGLSAILVLLHRTSPPEHRALINGTALLVASLARFVGPVSWGYVTTLGQRWGMAQLPWLVLAVIAAGLSLQAFSLDDHEEELEVSGLQEAVEDEIHAQYSSINQTETRQG